MESNNKSIEALGSSKSDIKTHETTKSGLISAMKGNRKMSSKADFTIQVIKEDNDYDGFNGGRRTSFLGSMGSNVFTNPRKESIKEDNEEEEEKEEKKEKENSEDEKEKESEQSSAYIKQMNSKLSMNSFGSSKNNGGFRFSREISETFSSKFYEMKWCLLSMAVNTLLISFILNLSGPGLLVYLPIDFLKTFGGVVFEIILLISNILTNRAMDHGFQAYFGHLLGLKGISMVVCGFNHCSSIFKWSFANQLSLNSTVRKLLNRLSILWIIMELLKLATPVPATSLQQSAVYISDGVIDCIEFGQAGLPIDRKWPIMDVESGLTELIFGSSIGNLRSESSEDLNCTTAIIGPQLVGAVNDGDTILGKGYLADIVTSCTCSASGSASDLEVAGVSPLISEQISNQTRYMAKHFNGLGLVTGLLLDNDSINITGVLTNTVLCGGLQVETLPVCTTIVNHHRRGNIKMTFMTDGTTASIAQKNSTIVDDYLEPADLNWAYQAFENMFEGQISTYAFPATVPGMINPLMYWTTVDLMTIDPSMLVAGLETYYTIILRAGIQRTYSSSGQHCTRIVTQPSTSFLSLSQSGMQIAVTTLTIQLIFSFCSILAFIPWFMSQKPIGPAVRSIRESIYFTNLLADSKFSDNIRGLCNAPTHAIWQGLDIIVRVGESVETLDDEVGHITMDKPKIVRPLTNGRIYAGY